MLFPFPYGVQQLAAVSIFLIRSISGKDIAKLNSRMCLYAILRQKLLYFLQTFFQFPNALFSPGKKPLLLSAFQIKIRFPYSKRIDNILSLQGSKRRQGKQDHKRPQYKVQQKHQKSPLLIYHIIQGKKARHSPFFMSVQF